MADLQELARQLAEKLALVDKVKELHPKGDGDLILSADWNDLAAAVEAVWQGSGIALLIAREEIAKAIADGDGQVRTDLTALLEALGVTVNAIKTNVEKLKGQFYRLTLSTQATQYALGQVAEITAQVSDLDGQPVKPAGDARPWVDFVASWGQLKPADGFGGAVGAGNRTISVQVNEEGVAKVVLTADHAADLTADDDKSVAAALDTQIVVSGGAKGVWQTFMEAKTPADADVQQAYRQMATQYDRGGLVQQYVDKYYYKNSESVTGKIRPHDHVTWRDYRVLVTAFVTDDSDPTTPDQSRGSGCLRVTFRDWIYSWIGQYYIVDPQELIPDYSERLRQKITKKYAESLEGLQTEINSIVTGKGLLGSVKEYRAIYKALDQVNPPDPPEFFGALRGHVQDVVGFQQTLQIAQFGTAGAVGQEIALKTFTGAAVHTDGLVAAAQQTLDDVNGQIADAQKDLADLRKVRDSFGEVVAAAKEVEKSARESVEKAKAEFQLQLANHLTLVDAKVQSVTAEVGDIKGRMPAVEQGVGELRGKVAEVHTFFLGENSDFQTTKHVVTELQTGFGKFQQPDLEAERIRSKLRDVEKLGDIDILVQKISRLP